MVSKPSSRSFAPTSSASFLGFLQRRHVAVGAVTDDKSHALFGVAGRYADGHQHHGANYCC